MNAVTKTDAEVHASAPVAVAVVGDTASIMQVISRVASDPNADVDKLERVIAAYERINAVNARAAFDSALAEMQPKMPIVDRRGKITIRDKNDRETVIQSTPYALFEDIHAAIAPILAEHGFAVSFRTSAENKVKVTCVLSHRAGHREETALELMHDSTGSKNSVQAIGSSVSYGKRYTMCSLLNIATKGEDDDGKGADKTEITSEQVDELLKTIMDTKSDLPKFLTYMGVAHITDIKAAHFQKAKNALLAKVKKQAAK